MARIKGYAMGQVLHGSATTTEAIRRAIQHSKESLRALARRYGVNQKTVRKWKARATLAQLSCYGTTRKYSSFARPIRISGGLLVGASSHMKLQFRAVLEMETLLLDL